jgi:hypothetical protein
MEYSLYILYRNKTSIFMIPQQNLDLWNRIQQFELDVPNVSFPFSKRLARENGWTHLCFKSDSRI